MSYLAVYIVRNILSAVTPAIVKEGTFSTEQIGSLSSVFFIAYAVGQLVNGVMGDHIKAKYMVSFGLLLSGICHTLFPLLSTNFLIVYISYGLTGFFLSMIYAPMTKVTAENTKLIYATRCSLGYTFSSFLGSPLAGVFAVWMTWQGVFYTGSATLVLMGLLCLILFSWMERKKIIQYRPVQKTKTKTQTGGIRLLLKRQILKFTGVAVLSGIVRTTVVFWMPTYISQYLDFSPKTSALLFTVATFVISAAAFIAVFLYELLKNDMDLTLLLSFIAAAVSFALVFFIKQPALNIFFLVFAIMASNSAATMIWSVYCPSLEDTGFVSSATGFLDFSSYIAAAVSSIAFANAVSKIGWSGLILTWFALMVLGVLISLPFGRNARQNAS